MQFQPFGYPNYHLGLKNVAKTLLDAKKKGFYRPMKFTIDLTGVKDFQKKLKQLMPVLVKASEKSLYESGEAIMARSKEEFVPVDTGSLRATGVVELIPDGTGYEAQVVLGYGGPSAPYALAVHENPRAGKTGGFSPTGKPYKHYATTGSWKYLETPLKEATYEGGPVAMKLKADLEAAMETLA